MANGLAEIARIAESLPEELRKSEPRAVRRTALVVTRAIRDEIRSASGGDNRLSGVGRRGARVGAGYKTYSNGRMAIIKARGPLHLIERSTGPHQISAYGRGALRLANGGFARSVNHPGTAAKRPFEKGYLASRDEAGRIFDSEIAKGIGRVIR